MFFDLDRCKCLHVRYGNPDLTSANLKEQCGTEDLKANRITRLITRIIDRKEEIIIQLYKSTIRSHLEYCIQAW